MDTVCDGVEDCTDVLDELNCTYTSCSDNFFSCDSKCYFYQMWCVQQLQCEDGSDEAECNDFTFEDGLVQYEFTHSLFFLVCLIVNVVTNFVK